MKNFLLAVLGLFAALPLCAANNIKMVTYFPVPYASYNDLKVSGTCDVGLLDDCTLDAGSSLRVLKDASRTNNEGKLEVIRGRLALNGSGSVYGQTLQFGRNLLIGGELQFKHNLDVTTMPGSAITSMQVSNQAKLNKLNLFEKYDFPGCDGTDNEINWKRLTVNGAEGVFLVCGAGTESSSSGDCDIETEECCARSSEYFIAHRAYCCEHTEDVLMDKRCWSWRLEMEVTPENSGSSDCVSLVPGPWDSSGTNVSACESVIQDDPYWVCPLVAGDYDETHTPVCTDSRSNYEKTANDKYYGKYCYKDYYMWYCEGERLY